MITEPMPSPIDPALFLGCSDVEAVLWKVDTVFSDGNKAGRGGSDSRDASGVLDDHWGCTFLGMLRPDYGDGPHLAFSTIKASQRTELNLSLAVWSPDGQYVLTSGADRRATLWAIRD
jgi:WD40 repeat protein